MELKSEVALVEAVVLEEDTVVVTQGVGLEAEAVLIEQVGDGIGKSKICYYYKESH